MEIGNVALFTSLMWYLAYSNPGLVSYFSVAGLATLNALLLRGLYVLKVLLLLTLPASILAAVVTGAPALALYDVLIGLGCYLFGVGEFLHYFVFKINARPRELKRLLRERRPMPARLLRELRQAGLRAERDTEHPDER